MSEEINSCGTNGERCSADFGPAQNAPAPYAAPNTMLISFDGKYFLIGFGRALPVRLDDSNHPKRLLFLNGGA